jgi:hypothetical protein
VLANDIAIVPAISTLDINIPELCLLELRKGFILVVNSYYSIGSIPY